MGNLITILILGYIVIGAIIAIGFWMGVLTHRDLVYTQSSKRVRALLVPGFVALWPLMITQRVSIVESSLPEDLS